MNDSLLKLINEDKVLENLENPLQNGMALILAATSKNQELQKAKLYETAKFSNWSIQAKSIFDDLNSKNIPFIVLKGFAFSYSIYSGQIVRPYSDIDIWVDQANYSKVNNLLKANGFKQVISRQGQLISKQNSFYNSENYSLTIDVHWEISNKVEFSQYFDFSEVLSTSMALKKQSLQFKTLNLAMAFLFSCFHYIAHKPKDRKHIWLYDLALLWLKMNANEQESCLGLAEKYKLTKVLNFCFKKLSQAFPNSFSEEIQLPTTQNELSASYIANGSSLKLRIKNIKGLANKLKLAKEFVFPGRKYLEHRLNLKPSYWSFIFYPKLFWLEILDKRK